MTDAAEREVRRRAALDVARQDRARRYEPRSLDALDDGGAWYRCRECATFARLTPDGEVRVVRCSSCTDQTEHVRDVPSWAAE